MSAVDEARKYLPDVIGISSVTFDSALMHDLARALKKALPSAKLIAGGPHPSSYVEETLSNTSIDVSVLGEGETTFAELLPKLVSGDDLSDVRGLALRKNGSIVRNESRPCIEDLDSLRFPAWDLLKREAYWNQNSFGRLDPRRYMSLLSSRACPYGCIYCHKLFGTGFRARSVENVLLEMETLGDLYGITNYEFIDDCFNLDRGRVEDICDGILSRGWKLTLSFGNGLRGDRLDRSILKKMKQAGTCEIAVAVETASPRLQKLIGKNLNLERIKQTINDAMILGIPCDGFFMLGFPTETEAEMIETVRFAIESKLLYAHFTIVTRPSKDPDQGHPSRHGRTRMDVRDTRLRSPPHALRVKGMGALRSKTGQRYEPMTLLRTNLKARYGIFLFWGVAHRILRMRCTLI